MKKIVLPAFLLIFFALFAPPAARAAPLPQFGGTQVIINNPANNSSFQAGQTIGIASTSSAPGGIQTVQLFIDNQQLTQSSPSFPQSPFSVTQYWTTTPGFHTITVRAISSQNIAGQQSISVNVSGGPVGPTSTPNPCVVGAAFLGDVNYPPGSVLQPGQQFQKIWQVRNTGSCIWINGYGVRNIQGGTLSAQSPSPIPNTAPGQNNNISVNMVAPTQQGSYTSVWRLRAINGALFGPNLNVQITVQSGSGCSGVPQISSFYASPSTIRQGQSTTLVWGQVTNTDQVRLQTPDGSSSVPSPYQVNVSPTLSTTYILTAFCSGQRADRVANVTVTNQPPPTPTPPPFQQNQIFLSPAQQVGFGAVNVPVQYFYNNQNAPGQIQLTAFNNSGQPVGSSTVGAIPFSTQFTNVVISVPSGYQNAVQIQGCIIDRTQTPITCGQGLGIRQ